MNIRRFQGTRGGVNRDIFSTCSNVESSYEFWFLNNGLTIVCDQFDPMTDPDNPDVKLKDLQIVDGCQSATKLALVQRGSRQSHDVWVITRIYETTDLMLFSPIVLTTNNQNQSKSRNLRANDPVQLDSDDWLLNRATLQAQFAELQGGILNMEKLFEEAFSVLAGRVKGNAEYSGDVD